MKSGWWSVNFKITLEGEETEFEKLSECTKEYILDKILEGYIGGEIVED